MTDSTNDPDGKAAKEKFLRDLQKVTTPKPRKEQPVNPADPPSSDPRDKTRREKFKKIYGINDDSSF